MTVTEEPPCPGDPEGHDWLDVTHYASYAGEFICTRCPIKKEETSADVRYIIPD